MKRLLILAFVLISSAAFAAPNDCPAGANYNSTDGHSLVTLATLGINFCVYISKTAGASGNTGADKTHPWASAPGMASCTTGGCSTASPTAGWGFILKGGTGETWTASDLYWVYKGSWGSGTAGNPVYWGVDTTWFAGGSWTRPVFTCAPGSCAAGGSYYMLIGNSSINYVIVDNFEFTGLHEATVIHYLQYGGANGTAENLYGHGWEHTGATSDAGVFVASSGTLLTLRYNVCDGTDTTQDMMGCYGSTSGALGVTNFYGNIANHVANGQNGGVGSAHDNLFENISGGTFNTGHQNAWQITGPAGGVTKVFFYNNVLTNVNSGGSGQYWWGQGSNTGVTWYEFNNIMYATAAGNNINFCQSGTCGTHNIFNNTLECGSAAGGLGACINGAGITRATTLTLTNNHCINASSTSCSNGTGSGLSLTETDTLSQSVSQASGQGYTETSQFAFQPTKAAGGTVGQGTSISSLCSTITGLNADAGAACSKDTGYAVSYNTSNHTVTIPDRTKLARPSTPDIGAYQFTGSAQAVQPTCNVPTGTYSSTQTPLCTNNNTGGVTCYTTDGSLPVTNYPTSTSCTNGIGFTTTTHTITISSTTTLSLVSSTPSLSDSTEAQYVYTISSQAATPTFSIGTGTYNNNVAPTITSSSSGVTICYTINGDTPTAGTPGTCDSDSGNEFSLSNGGSITVSASETVNAIATKVGLTNSSMATAVYTMVVATPTFSPVAGNYSTPQSVTISTTTTSTVLHYAVNSAPTCSSTTYSTPVSVPSSETLEAIGCLSGYSNSSVASAVYTIGGISFLSGTGTCTSAFPFFVFTNTNVGNFTCNPVAGGDEIPIFVQCHPISGTITGITLTATGYTVGGFGPGSISQIVAPATTGSNSWAATYGVIALDGNPINFTATFTGGADCDNFSDALILEFAGGDQSGGATTFNAASSNGGAASTCNQTAANITPPQNNEAVAAFCLLGNATTANSPWTLGVTDGSGNSGEYQILSGGLGMAQTPAFNGTSGHYIVEGVAIVPGGGLGAGFGTNVGIGPNIGWH